MWRRYLQRPTLPPSCAVWRWPACRLSGSALFLCSQNHKTREPEESQQEDMDAFVRNTLRVEPDHIRRLLAVVEGKSVELPPPLKNNKKPSTQQRDDGARLSPSSVRQGKAQNVKSVRPKRKVQAVSKAEATALLTPCVSSHLETKHPLLWRQLHELARVVPPPRQHPGTKDSHHSVASSSPFEHHLRYAIRIAEAPLDLREREAWADIHSALERNPLYVDVLLLLFVGQCTRALLANGEASADSAAMETLCGTWEATLSHVLTRGTQRLDAREAGGAPYAVHVPSWCSEGLNALLSTLFTLKDHTSPGASPTPHARKDTARVEALLTRVAAVVTHLTSILDMDSEHFTFPENVLFHAQTVQRHVDSLARFHKSQLQNLPSRDGSGALSSVLASDVCLAHFVWLLRSMQQILLTFDAPGAAKEKTAFRAPQTDPSSGLYQLMQQHVASLEELWQLSTPFAQRKHAADRLLHHRTCHTMLNIKLAHYAQEQSALWRLAQQQQQQEKNGAQDGTLWEMVRQVEMTSTTPFWFYAPEKALHVVRHLQKVALLWARTVSQADGFHTALHAPQKAGAAHITRFWVPLHCIWIRTALAVELDLSLAVAHALGEQFCAPHRLDVAMEEEEERRNANTDSKADHYWTAGAAEHTLWNRIATETVALRVTAAELTSEAFSVYVARELQGREERARDGDKRPSELFLQMIRTLWFPLARRHYLCAAHRQRLSFYERKDTRRLMEAFLSVFLLQRSVSPSYEAFLADKAIATEEKEDDAHALEKRFVPVCGTTLTQAMEVSFFLAYFVTYLHRVTSSEVLFSQTAVDAYLTEMFYFLDVNTAKQLWHLRRHKKFFFFTGERRNHEFTAEPELQRRLAMSSLATVHAHVVYASVLWMPLYQLQEMFFLLLKFPHLFFSSFATLLDTSGTEQGDRREVVGASSSLSWPSTSAASTEAPPRSHKVQGEPVAARRRVHGYLVLRLYVISNVLRALGEMVLGKQREAPSSAAPAPDRTTENSLSTSIERLLTYEPVAARQRRHNQSRPWASAQARILYNQYNRLPAEMEGIFSVSGGYVRALQRVETTVRSALDHALLFDVSRRYEEEHKVPRPARAAGATTAEAAAPAAGSSSAPTGNPDAREALDDEGAVSPPTSIILRLTRADTRTQLGFVMDSATCCIRSVQVELEEGSVEQERREDGLSTASLSPFVVASRTAGVAEAEHFVGYKIVSVDGVAVHSSKDVVRLLQNSLSCDMELRSARAGRAG